MFSRIAYFLTITLVIVATLTVILPPSSVSADAGILCSSESPLTWQAASDVVRNQYPTGWIGSLDPSQEGFVGYFGQDGSGNMIIGWNGSAGTQLSLGTITAYYDYYNNGAYNLVPNGYSNYVILNIDGTYLSGGGNSLGNPACVTQVKGVTYDSSWNINQLPTTVGGEEPEEPQCEAWDIACYFGGFVGTIVDGFQGLADLFTGIITALGEFIADLVMPENENGEFENRFATIWNDMWSTLHDKLGILLFPFDFIAAFFASMSTHANLGGVVSTCATIPNPAWCTIGVPNLLGDNSVSFNIGALEQEFPALFNISIILLRFVWIAGVVAFLHGKYFSVVRS